MPRKSTKPPGATSQIATAAAPDDETLARIATLRAEGSSWAAVGRAVNRDAEELQRLCEQNRKFQSFHARARRAVMLEGLTESMFTLRRLLRDEDTRTAKSAAETLARVGMTFYRHRGRTRDKPPRADPRMRNLRIEDIEFVVWLSGTSDTQLAALSDHFRRTHPEIFAGTPTTSAATTVASEET